MIDTKNKKSTTDLVDLCRRFTGVYKPILQHLILITKEAIVPFNITWCLLLQRNLNVILWQDHSKQNIILYTFSKDYQHLQIYTSKDKIFGSNVSTHCKFLFVVCLVSPESNFSAGQWKMRLNDIKLYVRARACVCA